MQPVPNHFVVTVVPVGWCGDVAQLLQQMHNMTYLVEIKVNQIQPLFTDIISVAGREGGRVSK